MLFDSHLFPVFLSVFSPGLKVQVTAVASWALSRGKEADRLARVQCKADVITFVLFKSEPLLYVT